MSIKLPEPRSPADVFKETPVFSGSRPSWPEVWMNVATEISRRSCDPTLKVGAIIVPADNTAILGMGYNGMWRGGPNEVESLERGKSGTIHAEVNALVKAPYHYPLDKHMYVTHSPCRECAKLVLNARIARLVYKTPYRDTSGLDLLKSTGVEVWELTEAVAQATTT